MNKVVLMGRLTKDTELRYSQSATPVAVSRYTLAVDRRFKRDGEASADFINCVVFGKSAEFAEKYFKKGMKVCVSGRLQVNSWEDQGGQKRWGTDVIIEEQDFGESRSSSRSSEQFSYENNMPPVSEMEDTSSAPSGFTPINESIDDEDLPF